jgi:arabinan endo-1,5-alpha-L-arabinosidase
MINNGGSLVVENEGPLIGPGHAGIVTIHGKEWFSMHYESAGPGTRRTPLALRPLAWDQNDWPVVERVPSQPTTTTRP